MADKPVFSIITVTLNNFSGLQKTHHSLKIQSFQGFEWIVVDGGSTDGSKEYLFHTPANWSSGPDSGIYDAMNIGLRRAQGEYVLFLNAGDKLAFANTLARLVNFMKAEKLPPDFIYGDSLEGEAYKPSRDPVRIKYGMFTHHQAMIYRREALTNLEYDTRYKIAADYDLTARILKQRTLKKGSNILYYPLAVCVFEPGGISQKKAGLGRREQFAIRHRQKITGLRENIFIYSMQTAVWTARRLVPGLYWRMKSSGNKRPGFARI